ncbi:DUF2515 family protein [Alteribacter natronophilus]|uniref:DUF2515 family protein n=1 Tax=Alteribacter natronophilus TaxID=2583810 RepID=UPI00110E3019|nr:DUF2515 family protein [Alteribacter natronophilus]TMW73553.1 DUF2515 domain-containing protein [Alteribacter natronophilus]
MKMRLKEADERLISRIRTEVNKGNFDNISRTVFYSAFYKRNPEIKWAYLASMVSRNAGWAMTDLMSRPFTELLSPSFRARLFYTYERANWLIFSDAFAQLLIYEWSKRKGKPLFHLLPHFGVSNWIKEKWEYFWQRRDEEEILTALIVNEQNLIQEPVILERFEGKNVFRTSAFKWQDRLHFSTVLFPDLRGNLYGCSVHDFTKAGSRIELGRKLAWILTESPEKDEILRFHESVTPTGSRRDYQRFLSRTYPATPILRMAYEPVEHRREYDSDWSVNPAVQPDRWMKRLKPVNDYDLGEWYEGKLHQEEAAVKVERLYRKAAARVKLAKRRMV